MNISTKFLPLNASEKSRQQVPQQETPSNGHQTTSAVTPYIRMERCRNFNRSRSANNEYFNEISSLNASENSRQQVPQQETPTTGHQTPSAVTPCVNQGKTPEFQIAPVHQPNNKSA
jgi:hypothetical protein